MGKAVTAFKDIGKACSDLLSKDFKVGKSTVELKSKTPNGITFTPSGTRTDKDNSFSGSLAAKKAIMSGLDGEVTLNTSGIVALNLEMADALTKGLKLILDAETPKPGDDKAKGLLASGKCTAEYKSELLNCKTSYDYMKSDAAVALATAYQSLTLGCSAGFKSSALTKMEVACQFVQPDFTVALKMADAKGSKTYTGSYYHKVSGDMQVGGELSKDMKKPDVGLAFGCSYKLDKDTTVKGKVDAEGVLCASYKQKVSPLTTMTLAAQIDSTDLASSKHKFGMVINLTP